MKLFEYNSCCGIIPAVRISPSGEILWSGGNVFNTGTGEYIIHLCYMRPQRPTRKRLAEMVEIPEAPGWYYFDEDVVRKVAEWDFTDDWWDLDLFT